MRKISSRSIVLVVAMTLCAAVLGGSASHKKLFRRRPEAKDPVRTDKISARHSSKVESARLLATEYKTTPIMEYNRDRTLVMKNIFGFESGANLPSLLKFFADANGTNDSPSKSIATSETKWGYTKDYIVVNLPEGANLNNEYVFVQNTVTSATFRSEEPVYLYHDSSYSSTLTVSLALAIIFMVLSCCCWCGGVSQFYHLIRIAQLLHMMNMISSRPHPAGSFALLDNFRYNLFNVIPFPVRIDEYAGNECQPSIEFYGQDWSCHVYNSLRRYVLAFFIYLCIYFFIAVNKYHDREFFARLKKTMDLEIFMLAIMPDVFLAIYVNAVAGLTNSVLSIGFLLCILLIFWYGYIFTSYLGNYFNHNRYKTADFLRFYVFTRNTLLSKDKRLGPKILAVSLDNLKILIVVTMIGLFYNAPKTQMVIVFLAFFFNAIFLFAVRPYVNLFQNICFGVSDVCFGILVVLLFANHQQFYSTTMETKESSYDGGIMAMVFFIFIFNLIVFVIPVLKGKDSSDVSHGRVGTEAEDDDGINLRPKSILSEHRPEQKPEVKSEQTTEKPTELKNQVVKEPVEKPRAVERDIHTAEGTKSK